MATPISTFFASLGLPLRDKRRSWGAKNADVVLLKTWSDEYVARERRVCVLRELTGYPSLEAFGLDERIMQLQAMWETPMAGYTVIGTVKDPNAHPRVTASFRDDAVFCIKQLTVGDAGDVWAVLGEPVPLREFQAHAAAHRTSIPERPFPVDDAARSNVASSTFHEKIPLMRSWLIDVCRSGGTVTYSQVMDQFALAYYPLINAMDRIGKDCRAAEEPILTALIVTSEGRCSDGLFDAFGVVDDEAERRLCYAHWPRDSGSEQQEGVTTGTAEKSTTDTAVADFEQRVSRFVQVEVRPSQRAFRDAVFRACAGRCVVSGCEVPEALEAAHLQGRDWRQGHNEASDGVLLRRDLHTLYDRELLSFSLEGVVWLDTRVREYYAEFEGSKASVDIQTSQRGDAADF